MTNVKRMAGQLSVLRVDLMERIAQVQEGQVSVAPLVGTLVETYYVMTGDPESALARAKKEATREGRDHANRDKFYWTTPEPLEGKVLR